ncbi:MAG: VOC family protein [Chloroflexota bacterium]|nr:VOC family protein [Chloroflexota bacterium]
MSNPTITFEGLSLPVVSLQRSVPFYESLGFRAEIQTDRFALMRLGRGTVGLLEVGDRHGRVDDLSASLRVLVQVELGTDDLDALYEQLTAQGVTVRVPPRDRGFERSMQCVDPDGFTVEFAEGPRGHNATTRH